MTFRDRIVDFRRVKASDLRPSPENWRLHPAEQRDALEGVLERIGLADAVIARETPEGLVLVDGHLRREIDPDQVLPVLVVDLDASEAALVLATLDPLAAMAETDQDKLSSLLASMDDADRLIAEFVECVECQTINPELVEPPAVNTGHAEYRCPACGHTWAGSPTP